jgi:broad specificity polyphosphatase/5'/3'-nucleotidase SurE
MQILVYIREHAIRRYKQRIDKKVDNRTAREKILETVLFYFEKKEDEKKSQRAYIGSNVVVITKIHANKKDETAVTVLPPNFRNCWWNKIKNKR